LGRHPTQPNCGAQPGLASDEVLPRLQTHPQTIDIPVVDLSSDAKPSQKTHLLQAGAQVFLTKPIDVNELLDPSTPSPPNARTRSRTSLPNLTTEHHSPPFSSPSTASSI
jgi:CheY-like chemotaxis protein